MPDRDDKPDTSAAADQWREIAAAIRERIARRVDHIDTLDPVQLQAFLAATDSALWLEIVTGIYDQIIDARRAALERQAAYGG